MKPFFILSILLIGISCSSQEIKKDKIDVEEEACLEKKNINTSGMTNCAYEALTKWDAKLNKVYQSLLKELPDSAKIKLVTAQRSWLKFKQTDLDLIDATYGAAQGTLWRPLRVDKMSELTKSRALVLEELLETLPEMYLHATH